jgi:hypothetical protein
VKRERKKKSYDWRKLTTTNQKKQKKNKKKLSGNKGNFMGKCIFYKEKREKEKGLWYAQTDNDGKLKLNGRKLELTKLVLQRRMK